MITSVSRLVNSSEGQSFKICHFSLDLQNGKKVSLTYFPLCLKILKNVSYHDELIDLTIFSWTCRNGQVDVIKGDFL